MYSISSGRPRDGDCIAVEAYSPLRRLKHLYLEKRSEWADSGRRNLRQRSWLSSLPIVLLTSLTLGGCGSSALNSAGGNPGSDDATLSGLTCTNESITGAGTDTCTATLTTAAGKSGQLVSLSSNNTSVTVPSSLTVAAGATSATFTASVSAVNTAQTATLTASSGGGTQTYKISLGAAVPTLALQSTSVPFGDVEVASPSYQSVTLTSSGSAAVMLNSGLVSGTGYTISGVRFPSTLNPGQTATLEIEFDPIKPGVSDGSVTLTSNSVSGTTSTISLSGIGVAASYEVNLTWDAPAESSDPVAGYNVYRAISGTSAYQLLNSTLDAATAYTDTTVQDSTSYTYYVESVDNQGNQSVPSNKYTVSIP